MYYSSKNGIQISILTMDERTNQHVERLRGCQYNCCILQLPFAKNHNKTKDVVRFLNPSNSLNFDI